MLHGDTPHKNGRFSVRADVVVKTSNLESSRPCLADLIKERLYYLIQPIISLISGAFVSLPLGPAESG